MVNYIKRETWGRHQACLFGSLICAIIFIGVFYLYCVSAMVMETVTRNQNLQNLQAIKREYQTLEKSYLDILSIFNLEYAYSLGFVSENSLSYVSKQTPVAQSSGYDKAIRWFFGPNSHHRHLDFFRRRRSDLPLIWPADRKFWLLSRKSEPSIDGFSNKIPNCQSGNCLFPGKEWQAGFRRGGKRRI